MHFIYYGYLSSFVLVAHMMLWDVVSTQTLLFSQEDTLLHPGTIVEDISIPDHEYSLQQCVLL